MKKILLPLLALTLVSARLSAQPVINNQPVNQTVIFGSNATFSVMVTGVGPFTYQWQLNGTNLPNGVITTVAGNGQFDFFGDGDAATNASLSGPTGVAMDVHGNLFIADESNNRVREINTNGIITTVAGKNGGGFSGDGIAATNSSLAAPTDVAVDAYGNLFIADEFNNRIRRVDTNGVITTVAGTNSAGFSGDGGAATNARLSHPSGVALDVCDNLFIADQNNNRIRKVDTNGIITTVAGTNSADFSGDGGAAINASLNSPQSVASDTYGNLFIADTGNNRIREINTNGIITTIAGNGTNAYSGDGGAATNASLNFSTTYPGMVVDVYGNLFISDNSNQRVRKVDTNGIITTVAGNGTNDYSGDGGVATNASFRYPTGLALDAHGNLFIGDLFSSRIRKVTYQGATLPVINVTATNAGNYQVIITGANSSVTSSVVALTVVLPPVTPVLDSSGGMFNLTWSAMSNLTYQVQYNLDLATTNWIDLGSPITATNGSISTADVIGSNTQRFYRVQLVQ